jgi:outer membrane immunogenic protein
MKYLVIAAALAATGAQAQNFQGPWVEARAGWDHVSEAGTSESGFLYGAAAGYDFAFASKAFIGLQAGIAGSTMEYCDFGVCTKAGRDIEVLARAGVAVADRTALYALGGYTNGRINFSTAGLSGGVNADGFRLGAGVEQQFGSKTYTKLEYRYSNYGDATLAGFNLGDAGDRHQVSASFGIRF